MVSHCVLRLDRRPCSWPSGRQRGGELGLRGDGLDPGLGRHSHACAPPTLVRAAVVVNLVFLGFFKYYGFFTDAFADVLDAVGLDQPTGCWRSCCCGNLVLHVPRDQLRRHRPRRIRRAAGRTSPSTCRSSPTSWPGPSCEPASFAPQIRVRADPVTSGRRGLRLIAAGLFKKVVMSSYLAPALVDPVFGAAGAHGRWESWSRRLRLRHPDLRRLLWLHRHRHRLRVLLGHPLAGARIRPRTSIQDFCAVEP